MNKILALPAAILVAASLAGAHVPPKQLAEAPAPEVRKVEPPNWWIGFSPEVMLLLSGRNLEARKVACNLPTLTVERTQATAGGHYLFVWLKIARETKSGTAVCRITTPVGTTAFELPLSNRTPTLGRFQGLSPDDVIYRIAPDRFADGDPTNDQPVSPSRVHGLSDAVAARGGDLRGIREHLDYLKELGVSALSLTPICAGKAAAAGGEAVDLYAVDTHLGSVQDLQDLAAAAHQQGLKLLLDVDMNRVAPQNPWVRDPPMPDWFRRAGQRDTSSSSPKLGTFYGDEKGKNMDAHWLEALTDPHAPERLKRNPDTAPGSLNTELNTENPVVADYLLQNSIWWAELSGLDAFRIDALPSVSRKFWAEWHAGLRRIYPYLTTIGEVTHPDPDVTAFFVGGRKRFDGVDTRLSTVLDYPLFAAIRNVLLHGAPASSIAEVLRHDSLYVRPDLLVTFLGDEGRKRFASEDGSSTSKLKLAFGLLLTLRGIPQLYYGDEVALSSGADAHNQPEFPGGWPDDAHNAFSSYGRTKQQQDTFGYVHALLHLRATHEALRGGRLWHLAADEDSYVFLRESEEEKIVVAFNNSAQPHELSIPLLDTPASTAQGAWLLLGAAKADVDSGVLRIDMPGQSISIFSLN